MGSLKDRLTATGGRHLAKRIPQLSPAQIECFWSKVDRSGGPDACWPWSGVRRPHAYGKCRLLGGQYRAHRVAYVLTKGEVAEHLVLDHKCQNPPCCNPAHIEPVTHVENVLRGKRARTCCVRGHPYTAEDAVIRDGVRHCRTCLRIAAKKHRTKRRASPSACLAEAAYRRAWFAARVLADPERAARERSVRAAKAREYRARLRGDVARREHLRALSRASYLRCKAAKRAQG